jgi:uncharacterized protein YndB with AHSA1/START domain
MMSEFRVERHYPHPVGLVWRALTDPALIPRWTSTGRGGRPEGFEPVVGNRFRFVAKPVAGWHGIVACEVLEVDAPRLLRYTWVGDEGARPSFVAYRLTGKGDGTDLVWEHTGFTGVGGFFMARLLHRVRVTMLTEALPTVLDAMEIG